MTQATRQTPTATVGLVLALTGFGWLVWLLWAVGPPRTDLIILWSTSVVLSGATLISGALAALFAYEEGLALRRYIGRPEPAPRAGTQSKYSDSDIGAVVGTVRDGAVEGRDISGTEPAPGAGTPRVYRVSNGNGTTTEFESDDAGEGGEIGRPEAAPGAGTPRVYRVSNGNGTFTEFESGGSVEGGNLGRDANPTLEFKEAADVKREPPDPDDVDAT